MILKCRRSLRRSIRKVFCHWWTGHCEIERCCSMSYSNDAALQIITCIRLSKQLRNLQNTLQEWDTIKVDETIDEIMQAKGIKDTVSMENLKLTLKQMNVLQCTGTQIVEWKKTFYDSENTKHEILLESLWDTLKPGVQRKGGRFTKEWGEIGFQGKDPSSDFRSMGVLSLIQLVYFATNHPIKAQRALLDSNHPTAWYPFSCVGINVSSFLFDLLNERLLDHYIMEKCPGDGVTAFHEFYCTVFMELNTAWVAANPVDLRSFQPIFEKVKRNVRERETKRAYAFA